MRSQSFGAPDTFEAVNGPEDGTEFPVTRSPVDIGADPGCGIVLQCDRDVQRIHARVTVVSEGYRIRKRQGGGAVYVDGRRAGAIRSRIVRHGGIVQVGNTELALQCAPDGLASRSHGLPQESDIGWAVRLFAQYAAVFLSMPVRFLRGFLGPFFWFLIVIAAFVALAAYSKPWLVDWLVSWIRYFMLWTWSRTTGGIHRPPE